MPNKKTGLEIVKDLLEWKCFFSIKELEIIKQDLDRKEQLEQENAKYKKALRLISKYIEPVYVDDLDEPYGIGVGYDWYTTTKEKYELIEEVLEDAKGNE